MRKLILVELTLLFLATTFRSDNPPGWYQQQLPVNDFVRDIFFLDSLNGWSATVSYVLRTTNGGDNWIVVDSSNDSYYKIQFFDNNTGYRSGVLGGGGAAVWKTTDGGYNWDLKYNFGLGFGIEGLQFLNEDKGWVSSSDFDFGGLWKTTNGGNSWVRQIAPSLSVRIKAISILNKDTGWVISSASQSDLYRTINGGLNWNVQYTFTGQRNDIYFLNKDTGIVTGGTNYRTTDGGFTWIQSNDGGIKIDFADNRVGWAGNNLTTIIKTANGGINWYRQTTGISNPSVSAYDSLTAWAGGSGVVHTTDGGPVYIVNQNNFIPNDFILFQNYPNPFNPETIISYQLKVSSYVKLTVYYISGKEISELVNKKQNSGEYKINFNASELPSGVYFYKLQVLDEKSNQVYSETKKMILVK